MKEKIYIFFVFLLIIVSVNSCKKTTTGTKINLNGNWEVKYNEQWINADVPGNIHCDLFNNNIIPDPNYASNSDSINWIAEQTWKYRKEVTISNYNFDRNYELIFEGIDTYSDIFFNSVKLGSTENMFLRYRFSIPDTLIKEKNLIEVIIYPSIKINQKNADSSKYVMDNKRIFTRKAQFQSGWDWAPSFESCGIYKNVYINSWVKMKMENVFVNCDKITDSIAYLTAFFEIESQNYYNGSFKVISNNSEFDTIFQNIEIFEGKHKYKKEFTIKNPKLWWCNGLGEAKLYDISLQISSNFRILENKLKIGLREINFKRENDKIGESFCFEINGVPVFAKGANWIPAEYFSGKNTRENYLYLLKLAKEANFNMLRVWGGGIYENDDFYNICDSLGIMIWQDFMFACAIYPSDSLFINNIKHEAIYQINRLKSHPSLVLWCGNNEISNAWFDWGWQKHYNINIEDSLKIWEDYQKVFEKILPEIVAEKDPDRKYFASSPLYGWGHKECITHGDSHYWGVWWGMEDFSVFYSKTGRFMSEYGMQSFPNYSSLKKFIPNDSLFLWSKSLKTHQKHKKGFETIDEYINRGYNTTNDINKYSYISQIMQAEGMQIAFDAHLSNMPHCMGTLFWQYNDCWPAISWSAIDYYKIPKALYFCAKRNFAQIRTVKDEKNNLSLVNHNNEDAQIKAILKKYSIDGYILFIDSIEFIARKLSLTKLPFKLSDSINLYSELLIYDNKNDSLIDTRIFTNKNNKDLSIYESGIDVSQEKLQNYFVIRIKSNVFIKNLYLSVNNCEGYLSDNYFDLPINYEKKILFYPKNNKLIDKELNLSYLFCK